MVKPITDRIAELKAKQDKLAAKLNTLSAKAKQEDRKRDTRRKIVIGAAILTAIENEPSLVPVVRRMLATFITRDQDREVVADLLEIAPPPAPAAAPAGPTVAGAAAVSATPPAIDWRNLPTMQTAQPRKF